MMGCGLQGDDQRVDPRLPNVVLSLSRQFSLLDYNKYIVTRNMYCFPYLLNPYYFGQGLMPLLTINQSPDEQYLSLPHTSVQQFSKEAPIPQIEEKIALTRQDLEEAGYEINKKVWTQEEDRLLIFLREKKKMDWCQISKKIAERNKKMCYSRYRRLKNSTKVQWLKRDDQKLLRLVQEMGENWVQIVKCFKNRNVRQVKEHYNNYLRPGITECEWTLDDDLKLIGLLNDHGKNWKIIEDALPGRSLNQIKNRYYGRIKKLNDKKLMRQESSDVDNL